MRSITLLLRALWALSILSFLVTLFLSYYYWPDFVDILFDNEGYSTYSVTRNTLFYSVTGFLLAMNLLFIVIKKLLPKIADSLNFVPNSEYWFSTNHSKEFVVNIFQNWINSFLFWINLFIGMFCGAIAFANLANLENRRELAEFQWLLPLLLVIVVFHFLYLGIRFFIKNGDIAEA